MKTISYNRTALLRVVMLSVVALLSMTWANGAAAANSPPLRKMRLKDNKTASFSGKIELKQCMWYHHKSSVEIGPTSFSPVVVNVFAWNIRT